MTSKKRQTIVWALLHSITVPALSAATVMGMNGRYVESAVAGAIGVVAAVAFAASVAFEHPVEEQAQEMLNEVAGTKQGIAGLAERVADLIEALEADQSGSDTDGNQEG